MPRKKSIGFTISTVASKYDLHPQTLRGYERAGLLRPSRTEGNTRFYTDEDLKRLEFILTLRRDLGVNLAGVEVVLHMRERMERMQEEVERLIDSIREQVDSADLKSGSAEALIRVPPFGLARTCIDEDFGTERKG